MRVGSAPRTPVGARALGALSAGSAMHLVVALRPRDPAGLAAYASAVSTPGSPDDHRYLTPAQFRQVFAPTGGQIARVDAALRSRGLDPGAASADGLLIPVDASAGAVARGLRVGFRRYRLASGRVAYTNTVAPSFSSAIGPLVDGVVGLDDIHLPHAVGLARLGHAERAGAIEPHVVTGGPQPCPTATTDAPSQDAYTADQLASAYNFSSLYQAGDEGAGQTIGLLELSDNVAGDIAAYQSCYGTNATVTDIPEDGGAGASTTVDGAAEATLDIEDVIGLAPKATIDVFQAPNSNAGVLADYAAMFASPVTVVSTSWGECESAAGAAAIAAEATLFQQAATEGKSVFAAAGDDGSSDCSTGANPNPALAVDDPASQPFVTGVGGLTLSNTTFPPVESVWNDSGSQEGAGGGGISAVHSMPTYQSAAPASLGVVNGNSSGTTCGAPAGGYCREVPDVSADGDPQTGYLVYFLGSWTGIGGTSAAAPLWAAFAALTNASSACGGRSIGFANPALYASAASAYASDFTDVTSGNNDYTPSGYPGALYPATSGYDMASGLGSPNGATLATALCGVPIVTVTNPGSQTGTAGTPVALQIAGADSAHEPLTFSATGLPAGLAISSSGAITGVPATAGTVSVTVTATDASNVSAQTSFSWTIGAPPQTTTSPSTTPPPATAPAPSTTPAPTPTVTCANGQLLANPGFELGGRAWTASAAVITTRRLAGRKESPHSGAAFAWLGGRGSQRTTKLSQTVAVPAACQTATLTFWRHIDTTRRRGGGAVDKLTVQLVSASGTVMKTLATYSNRNAAAGYQRVSLNLGEEAGTALTVRFTSTLAKRGSGTTDFCLDDTALSVS